MWRFFREMQLLQNSRTPYVTCDGFFEERYNAKIQEHLMWHVTVFLKRDTMPKFKNILCDMWRFFREMQLLQNSRTPHVTCDGLVERCNAKNSRTPYVTCDGFLERYNAKNSRTPYVTCDGFLERYNAKNSRTPYVTCDSFLERWVITKFKNTLCDMWRFFREMQC